MTTSPGPILRLMPFWMPLPSVLGPFNTVTTSLLEGTSLGSLSVPPVTSVPLPEMT